MSAPLDLSICHPLPTGISWPPQPTLLIYVVEDTVPSFQRLFCTVYRSARNNDPLSVEMLLLNIQTLTSTNVKVQNQLPDTSAMGREAEASAAVGNFGWPPYMHNRSVWRPHVQSWSNSCIYFLNPFPNVDFPSNLVWYSWLTVLLALHNPSVFVYMWITAVPSWVNLMHWRLLMVFHEAKKYFGQPRLHLSWNKWFASDIQ